MTLTPLIRALLLDMDGVLFQGESVLPGAAAFMAVIRQTRHAFVTNNPTLSAQAVASKLARLGLGHHDARLVVTSAAATADYLAQLKPGFRYFAVGADGLHQALRQKGRPDREQADFVVVGEGEGLDYRSLTTGINLILRKGARLVGTNPDANVDGTFEGRHCVLPGGGALLAPFCVATGVQPLVIGKPEPFLYQMALERLAVEPADCVMVGDRPDTDIEGAQRLGMKTALVRTGRFRPGEPLPDGVRPDWDVTSLKALLSAWGWRLKSGQDHSV